MIQKPIDIIIDSDASNSADDQIAIAYAALLKERLCIKGICAAPYVNENAKDPQIGVNNAYSCINELLKVMDMHKEIPVFKGCDSFMHENNNKSFEAIDFIIKLAKQYNDDNRLNILMLGAATNVASAILASPEIVNKIKVIRVGGHSFSHPYNMEYNMMQDIIAEQIVFHADLPLIHIPCEGVANVLMVTKDEIEKILSNNPNNLSRYLLETVANHMRKRQTNQYSWSFPIWDLAAVSWVCNDDENFMYSVVANRPKIGADGRYIFDNGVLQETYVYKIKRDGIINDLIDKIKNYERG